MMERPARDTTAYGFLVIVRGIYPKGARASRNPSPSVIVRCVPARRPILIVDIERRPYEQAPCEAKEPSLVVRQLSERRKGRVGLWVGNTSGGDFANLKIVAKE